MISPPKLVSLFKHAKSSFHFENFLEPKKSPQKSY